MSFRVGWLLVGVGLLCGGVAATLLLGSVGPAFKGAFLRHPCDTPCSEVLRLEAGHHLVFEEIGRSTEVGPFSSTFERQATITVGDVVVTSPTGRSLAVARPSSSQTIERDGVIHGGVVSFDVPEPGDHRIVVDAPGSTRVLVAPGLGQTFLAALPGLAVAALGLVAGVTGLVLLILAWNRRRTAERPA